MVGLHLYNDNARAESPRCAVRRNMSATADLICQNLEEVLTRDDLERLIASGTPLRHYIGFEISGKVHLGTGLACLAKVKDFVDARVDCAIFLADWHSWINDKLGGDRETIRRM